MVAGVRPADPAISEEARSILEIDSEKFAKSNRVASKEPLLWYIKICIRESKQKMEIKQESKMRTSVITVLYLLLYYFIDFVIINTIHIVSKRFIILYINLI